MAFTQDKILKIVNFIDNNKYRIDRAKQKLNIYEGSLLPYVEHALKMELSDSAFERARRRIPPINMLTKTVNKLSSLYTNTVIREIRSQSKNNIDILNLYSELLNIDNEGRDSNIQLNLNKYTAFEIYISEDNVPEARLRVLPANQFLVYSDNREDLTQETVFIKMMGTYNKSTGEIDEVTKQHIIKSVNLYKLFDKDQIIVIDSDGEVRTEFMQGNPEGINPYGIIPFVYVRNSKYNLLPIEDTSDIPLTTLIPVLLTDLNYATQFMSHSIIYAIDADISNLDGNPDSVWMIKSDTTDIEEENKKASIGTIKPEVDIDKVLKLIETQLALWLDSKDIKANGMGNAGTNSLASGISKLIDEADTTKAIKSQIEIYRKAERELWYKLGIMHNLWVEQGFMVGTEVNKKTDGPLIVNTQFEEPKVIVDEEKQIKTISDKEDRGYITHKMAVQEANPKKTEEEVNLIIEIVKQESEEKRTMFMEVMDEEGQEEETDQENQLASERSENEEE